VKLEMRGVAKRFTGSDGNTVTALERINLVIREGEFVCVVGPSGCGKSTLLGLLAGLDRPSEGVISTNGSTVRGTDSRRVLIFQDAALFPWLSVQANVEFGLRMPSVRPSRTVSCRWCTWTRLRTRSCTSSRAG
jgi:sulfonate transport system ATP-binding protein